MSTNCNTILLGYEEKYGIFMLNIFYWLIIVGLILQGGYGKPKNVRILGVLQRLALCYFITAVIVLIFDNAEDDPHSVQWPIGENKF
jgi:hypothetical protein